jgi:hypothetical protein
MQLAGEFKRLNLVPIKKAVLDPRKGMILRTYYVNPEKFYESVLKQKLKRTQIYIPKLPKPIMKAEQEKSLSPLKDVVGENSFEIVLRKKKEDLYVPFEKPSENLQKGSIELIRFILQLDKKALTRSKKPIEKSGVIISINEKVKVKKAKRIKTKVKKVKSEKISEQMSVQSKKPIEAIDPEEKLKELIYLDGAKVEITRELTELKFPVKAGENLTKTIALLNPTPIKTVAIMTSYAGRDFEDKKAIARNTQVSQVAIIKESKSFTPLLYNLIVQSESSMNIKDFGKSDYKSLYYNYCSLLRISKSEASELIVAFDRHEVYSFVETLKKKGLKWLVSSPDSDYGRKSGFSYCLPIFSSLQDLVKYVIDSKDYEMFYASAYRSDTTPALLERILSFIDDFSSPTKNYSTLIENLSKFYTAQVDEISLKDVLRLVSVGRILKSAYIPYQLIPYIKEAKTYPFALNFIPKISKKLLDSEALKYLKSSYVDGEISAYIPIRNTPEKNIQNRRMLPLDVAFIDIDTVDVMLKNQGNKVDFVPVKLKGYFKVDGDNSVVGFIPSLVL